MKTAAIHYFSGTGNTLHAMNVVKSKLEEAGYGVEMIDVGQEKRPMDRQRDLHIFAFPAYACAAPHIMQKYMKGFRRVEGEKAAVVAVFGNTEKVPGYAGQAMAQCARILKRRGFDVFFTESQGYVYNWIQFTPLPKPEFHEKIFSEADARMEEISEGIIRGERSCKECSFLTHLWAWPFWLVYTLIGRHALGKLFVADSTCNFCGKCARTCPAGAIRMTGGKPRWDYKCEGCQRCINSCPQKSIQTSLVRMLFGVLSLPAAVVMMKSLRLPLSWPFTSIADFAGWLVAAWVLDKLLLLLEMIPGVRKLSGYSFTRRYKRYLAPGYKPLQKKT